MKTDDELIEQIESEMFCVLFSGYEVAIRKCFAVIREQEREACAELCERVGDVSFRSHLEKQALGEPPRK